MLDHNHSGLTQPCYPLYVDTVSTSKRWAVNRHILHWPISMVSQ